MAFDTPTYNIKLYTANNIFKKTINNNKIMSKISFSQNVGAGQGQLVVDINEPFNSPDYTEGDLIKVIVFNKKNPDGQQIYFGQVTKLSRLQDTNSQNISLVCLGIHYIANNIILQVGFNTDPGDIVKAIIDVINSKYPGALLSYAGGNIQNFGSNVGIGFNQITAAAALKSMVAATGFYYFVDAQGEVYFQPKPITATHKLTNQKDTEKIELTRNNEAVRNAVLLRYISTISINGVEFYGFVTSNDIPSQITNGFREVYIDAKDLIAVGDIAAAQIYADTRVAELTDIKNETKIIVNTEYDIISILPGHTIKILNFDYTIDNLQVLKTDYNGSTTTLTLERLFTFASAITSQN